MFWKKTIILYLALPMLCCLPAKAQKPGEIVSEQTIRKLGEKQFCSISPIPDPIFHLMQGKTYKKNCTIARSELRYLRCLHVDNDGRKIVGEMVVNKAIAADVLDILRDGGDEEEMLLSQFTDGLLADDFSGLLCLGWKAEKHGESKV